MKTIPLFRYLRFAILLLAPAMLFAQTGVPVKIWASASSVSHGGGDPATLDLNATFLPTLPNAANGNYYGHGFYNGSGVAGFGVSQKTVQLEPEKSYNLYVSGDWISFFAVTLAPPPGYLMEINGERRTRFTVGSIPSFYSDTLIVRVVAPSSDLGAPVRAGEGSSLAPDRIYWEVGMGSLQNGNSAGKLTLSDPGASDTWSTILTPAALGYENPSSEIKIFRSSGKLRQIITPQADVDIVTSTEDGGLGANQFEIRFYYPDPSQGMSSLHTFSGKDPYVKYRIEPGGTATSMKMTSYTRQHTSTTSSSPVRTAVATLARSGAASAWPAWTWTLHDWYTDGQTPLTETVATSSSGSGSTRNHVIAVQGNGGGTLARQTTQVYTPLSGWGEQLTSETVGSSDSIVSTNTYNTSTGAPAKFGYLLSTSDNGGGWTGYDYYDTSSDYYGQIKYVFRPFGSSSSSANTTDPTAGEVTYFEYSIDPFGVYRRPSLIETKVDNTATGKSTISYSNVSGTINGANVVESTRADYNDSTHSLTTVTRYYREDENNLFLRNLVHANTRPDGVKISYAYQRGSLSGTTFTKSGSDGLGAGSASRVAVITGTTGSGYTTYDGYDIDDLSLVDGKSTLQVTIRDARALVVRTETYVWTSGAWSSVPVSYTDFGYNYAGFLTSRTGNNGGTYSATYSGDQKTDDTDETGVIVTYGYDVEGRLYTAAKTSGPTTTYGYNAAGQVTSTSVSGSGTSETIVNATSYDTAGRVASVTPAGVNATTIAYAPSSRTSTATAPDTGTTIETRQIDGRLASITGTAVVSKTYTYSIDSGQLLTRCDHGSSSRWEKTWQDWLGRTAKTERPGWSGGTNFVETMTYDGTSGLLSKVERRDGSSNRLLDDVLFQYDSLGQVSRQGLDVGNGGSLVLASTDRIIDSNRSFEKIGSDWWLRDETLSYPTTNNATPHTESLVRTRLTGFSGIRAEVQATTTNGAVITKTVTVDTSLKKVTTTTSQAGIADRSETIVNGLPKDVTGSDNLTYTTGYDALGRPNTSVDPRTGTTTTAYYTGTTLPSTVTDGAGLLIGYHYDNSGRKDWEKNADTKYAYFSYTTRNQLYRQWGDLGTPVEHDYDSTYGDHTTQKTYRGGSGWSANTWPSSPGTADTVTWAYDPATALLNSKTDALSHAVSYSYNARGQTYQRTAARGASSNVVTTYTYDGGTGELSGVSYSDGLTTSLSYLYNRKGNNYQVDDATGTRSFDLCACGRVNEEDFSSFYGSRVLTYQYETSGGVVGRYKGFKLGSTSGSNSDLEQAYAFNTLSTSNGRFYSVTSTRSSGTGSRMFKYSYTGDSSLVGGVAVDGGYFSVSRGYKSNRNLLESIDSTWNSTSQTRFDYTYTSTLRRQTAKQSGVAFSDYYTGQSYSSVYNVYTYNDRGELVTAAMYRGNTPTPTPLATDELPGRRFEYRFDSAGNRSTSGDSGEAALGDDEYTTNGANQYSGRENNSVRFSGTADASARIAVSGATFAGKVDRAWGATLSRVASAAAVKDTSTVFAVSPGAGSGGSDALRSVTTPSYFAPKQAQTFGYDYAGNMTNDSVWDYVYDAEDRIVSMQTRGEVIGAGMLSTSDARRLEFVYDYLGRRVQKIVKSWNGSSYGTVVTNRKYLYDGWNLIAEFDAVSTLTLTRSYTWGLDQTGSLTATGGVGALLQIRDHTRSRTWLPTYDGNGNIVSLLDGEAGSSATIGAVYEYGPFGEPLRAQVIDTTDDSAANNPFRFSTKFTDAETGLVYYGLRYYSPSLGRFINRDPIEEEGGINLYGFVGNDPINNVDRVGLLVFNRWIFRSLGFGGYEDKPTELPPITVEGTRAYGSTKEEIIDSLNRGARGSTIRITIDLEIQVGSSKNTTKNIGDKFIESLEKKKLCEQMKAALDNLRANIENGIDSFGAIGKDFANANIYNNLQGAITLVQGAVALTQLTGSLVQNAARYAPIRGASGRIITSPMVREINGGFQTANAIIIGGKVVGQEGGQYLVGEYNDTTQRIFSPFQAAAQAGINNANAISQQTSNVVGQMQQAYINAKSIYEKECGGPN